MGQDKNKYKKPMMSSEGSALVAMTTSAVGKQVFLRAATVTTTVMTSMTVGNAGMPPAAISTYMHTNNIPFMTKHR